MVWFVTLSNEVYMKFPKLFLTDSELAERHPNMPEPQASIGELKAACAIIGMTVVTLVGIEIARDDPADNQIGCEPGQTQIYTDAESMTYTCE